MSMYNKICFDKYYYDFLYTTKYVLIIASVCEASSTYIWDAVWEQKFLEMVREFSSKIYIPHFQLYIQMCNEPARPGPTGNFP